ncbi:MAG: hypothetical protein ACR2NI_04920 [Pirellulales bacterium]
MRRISAAVQKSEGVKDRKGNKWYPVKGGGGATLQIGKTAAEWTKGTDATVDLYKTSDRTPITEADGTTPKKSGTIHNLFADVGADKWVAFMNGILIAAECDEE